MTRKEILHWAQETVNHIFHGHGHSQTFQAKVGYFAGKKVLTLKEPWALGKWPDSIMNLFVPNLDENFKAGDDVEITVKKP